ncbi:MULTISPECIES: hypothetical protein [unclassified Flavobacterium]|uniref:hypothetical protein n=1 Tax=unclassified Flavobacterium TaxID=196869 RepID=UPI00131C3AF1|nr:MULTISPECIES: hypothetical protein [unclassified Flavobacterium]
MTSVAILRDGRPVRTLLYDNPLFDIDGFLVEFTKGGNPPEVYRYLQQSDFKIEDRKKSNLEGYYNESIYLKYIQKVDPVPSIDLLTKYNFEKDLATEREDITVSTVDFNEPFNYFYNNKEFTFKIELAIDNKGIRNYLKPIIEDLKLIDYKINTGTTVGVVTLNNQSNNPGGYFYKKNFGDFVNAWTISDIQKSRFKKIMSLIIFKIRRINEKIIPIIANNTHFFDKEMQVADGIIAYNDPIYGLTDLEKLLFDLKRGWGYYYAPLDPTAFPLKENFDAVFNSLSTYDDYFKYYTGLVNFYNTCYRTKNLATYRSDEKLRYLLQILPSSALGILPYPLIIAAIKGLMKSVLDQDLQRFMVRLVLSVTTVHANEFLDFLLEKEDGNRTNFQHIYDSLTDARLERYTIVNWFVNEQTNRKYYAFAIYELWKVSRYNNEYNAPATGVNTNWYFYTHPSEINKKSFHELKFTSNTSVTSNGGLFTSKTKYSSQTNDKNIVIKEIYTEASIVSTPVGFSPGPNREIVKEIGIYHLFQPISFSGFESNLDLLIPQKAIVPAFLFHFIEEYDRLVDFDAKISLAINLTLDVLLLYFTGGASILRDLRYLQYTTDVGVAMTGPTTAMNVVEVWRGLEAGSQVFTLTAGSLAQINHYLITTENNAEKKKILEGTQKVFICLIFIGAGASIVTRMKAVREAENVLGLIDALPPGVASGLTADAISLLKTLKGQKAVSLTLFGNRLNTLDLAGVTNTIAPKYQLLTDAQKLLFWKDFSHIDDINDIALWRKLNSGMGSTGALDGSYVKNWLDLTEKGIALEARTLDFITNQKRVNAIIKFYDEPALKNVLQPLSYVTRLKFVDYFGDISSDLFNKFIQKPEKITEFINVDGAKRLFLKSNKHFWLVNGYKYEYIDSFKLEIIKAVNAYKSNTLFTDPLKKVEALDVLRNSSKFTKGDFVEKPMKIYLNNLLLNDEDVMYSVDILFKKANGTNFKPSIYLDIDAIVVNTSTNKIKTPYSAKLNVGDTFKNAGTKAYDDAQKLEFFRNLPEDISQAKSYIINQNKKVWKDVSRPQDLDQIFSIEVRYVNKLGQSQTMPLSSFKQKLKSTPYSRNDFTEINPSTFGTTRDELMESTYNRIIND